MDSPPPVGPVAAVVALKRLSLAKSRMASVPAALREQLALCMALDTVAALSAAVATVLMVTDQLDLRSALARHGLNPAVVPEPVDAPDGIDDTHGGDRGEASLNRALAYGDRLLRTEGAAVVLACVADLPALRTASVRRVLAASAGHRRSLLPDHADHGTTMLIARGVPLNPLYGGEIVTGGSRGSAARHRRSGAATLHLGTMPDARWDVDTVDDLRVAWRIGVGRATAALLDPSSGELGRLQTVEVRTTGPRTITVVVDGRAEEMPVHAYDGEPAHLVPGRRLHAVRAADALRCWD